MLRLEPFLYFSRQAWLQLVRDRSLTSTAILANLATLFVSALFLLIAFNLHAALDSIRSQREVQVFLERDAVDRWQAIGGELEAIEGVDEAVFISPDDAMNEFERDFGESGLIEALGENPLPASYRLTLADSHRSPDAINDIADRGRKLKGVESVRFGGVGIAHVEARVRVFATLNLLVGVLAGLSAILIVANTIRLTILARRDLVSILKLIGGHDQFVRLPFLLEGALQGALAGAGGLIVLGLVHAVVTSRFAGLLFFPAPLILAFLLFAGVLGGLGAWVATVGPLREHWRKS